MTEVGYRPDVVAVCATGALRGPTVIGYSYDTVNQAINLLSMVAQRLYPHLGPFGADAIIAVNDHPDTTKEDVLSIFDEAIKVAQQGVS